MLVPPRQGEHRRGVTDLPGDGRHAEKIGFWVRCSFV